MIKGVILAGGEGTRLRPLTLVNNKHLLPVYDKPMITYPIETLKSFGINEILLVSGGNHIGGFADFLGDGSEYGVDITYKVQKRAGGIAQALSLAESYANKDGILVILGDNVFGTFRSNIDVSKARLFLKEVDKPNRFGVARFGTDNSLINIEEKPIKAPSRFAVTGLYYYPNEVFSVIKTLRPSARGELEITDVNNYFIDKGCDYDVINGFWSDAGTFESLLLASQFISKQRIKL